MSSCSDNRDEIVGCGGSSPSRRDYFYIFVIVSGVLLYLGYLLNSNFFLFDGSIARLSQAFFQLFNTMFWGMVIGVVFVGILGRVPREYIISVLGRPGKKSSIVRATVAGILLDLCSHGILMVGMKLYEKGASLGQTMAFLIASPWNSLSFTVILISLVGIKWTLIFTLLSAVVALISGLMFDLLENRGVLLKNPNTREISDDFKLFSRLKSDMRSYRFSFGDCGKLVWSGFAGSKIIIKWLVFGAILSSLVKVFVSQEVFSAYFGSTLLGLGATLTVATALEVCSEGALPLAADLMNKGAAPGNSFTFLMAGVVTDYTEIMSLKETTKSWKIAFFLPLITLPQIILIALVLNGTL